ncbi:MAG: AAA family ATPase [Planctomycetes bacterium]|nr:AAA family ATPase [Planctomycetota bacterium]
MANHLHVCIYDASRESDPELERTIQGLNFVRLGARAHTPEELADVLRDESVNLLFLNLDPDPGGVVEVIGEVSNRYPDIALIALSERTDPQSILAPMRAGCDQFVCKPIDAADLGLAVTRAASKHLMNQGKSRSICITGASGGVGSTSIACNLALELAQLTDRTCALVDLDLEFGGVALNFDCEPKYTFHDLAAAGAGLDRTVLSSAVMSLECKVAILSRPALVEQHHEVTGETVQRVIQLLMAQYENVVIDVPRQHDARTATALAAADLIFIVCQPQVPSIRNTKRYCESLIRMGIPDERIKIILNREDRRSGRITVQDVTDTINKPVFARIPNDYQFVARSIDFGQPIASLDKDNPVRTAIRRMARDITADPESEDEGVKKRGLFSRLLSRQPA